jgi:hypothetical protein
MVPSFFCLSLYEGAQDRGRESERASSTNKEKDELDVPSWFVFLPPLILCKREAISRIFQYRSFSTTCNFKGCACGTFSIYPQKNKNQIPIRWPQFSCFPSCAKRLSLKIVNLRFALSLLSIIILCIFLNVHHRMLSGWNVITSKTATLWNALCNPLLFFFSLFLSLFFFFWYDDRCQFTSD